MAVQREIVDKDGNRLAVVQGGAGKSAVYGKTAEGEWVPLQVDDAGRAVLNSVDLRGLAANKPESPSVVGTTYWSVDTDPHAEAIEVWDGTRWVVM
jgi:hypothetical protein